MILVFLQNKGGYKIMKNNVGEQQFKPFISAEKILPEFTVTSIILGVLLAVIFGGQMHI